MADRSAVEGQLPSTSAFVHGDERCHRRESTLTGYSLAP